MKPKDWPLTSNGKDMDAGTTAAMVAWVPYLMVKVCSNGKMSISGLARLEISKIHIIVGPVCQYMVKIKRVNFM